MKIFKDVFTHDCMIANILPFTLQYDNVIMKFQSDYKWSDDGEKYNDVLDSANLVQIEFSRDDFQNYIVSFFKKLKT